MNDTYRSKYPAILEEDWVNLGYLPENRPKLTRNIHHLFQYSNASRPKDYPHIWPQYESEEEYNGMLKEMGPVLRLASCILESPKSLDFLHEVSHSPRKILLPHLLTNQGHRSKEFGWDAKSMAETRERARDSLRNLSHSLTFQIMDPESFPPVQGSLAITKHTLVGFMNGVKIDNVSSGAGSASRITINQIYVRKLMELKTQGEETIPEKMSLQLKLAVTLCHEVNHALANTVDRELFEIQREELHDLLGEHRDPKALGTDEPFYTGERMAEIGNSWENQVFGGKIIWSGESASDPLFVSKWPSFLTLSDGDPYPTRGREKTTARKYLVPFHYIMNLHRQEFWDSIRHDDVEALYIKKIVGIEYQNPDQSARSSDSSQDECPRDEGSSRVDREKNCRGSAAD